MLRVTPCYSPAKSIHHPALSFGSVHHVHRHHCLPLDVLAASDRITDYILHAYLQYPTPHRSVPKCASHRHIWPGVGLLGLRYPGCCPAASYGDNSLLPCPDSCLCPTYPSIGSQCHHEVMLATALHCARPHRDLFLTDIAHHLSNHAETQLTPRHRYFPYAEGYLWVTQPREHLTLGSKPVKSVVICGIH